MSEKPYDGPERRKKDFPGETEEERLQAKLAYDAGNLIDMADAISKEEGVLVAPKDLITRADDNVGALQRAIGIEFKRRHMEAAKQKELPPELEAMLRKSFDASLAVWGSFEGFWEKRAAAGHAKPSFDEYRELFAPHQDLMQPGRPEEFDKGYTMVSFVPSIPAVSENADKLTLLKLLKTTLEEEFRRRDEDKAANTLIVQTRNSGKLVLGADKVNIKDIVYRWEEYLKQGKVVHYPKALTPEGHGGLSESDLFRLGNSLTQKNGGDVRLDRPDIMMPRDLGRPKMSGRDWAGEVGKSIPAKVSLHDVHAGLAFLIQFIRTNHYVPDAWTGDESTSQVALMPETYFPKEASSGAVAAAIFGVVDGRFGLGRDNAAIRGQFYGVRGGVRG